MAVEWCSRIHQTTTASSLVPLLTTRPCHMCRGVMNRDSRSIYNILSMAEQEMNEVLKLPVDIIQEHIDKLVFYYGVGDKWNGLPLVSMMVQQSDVFF